MLLFDLKLFQNTIKKPIENDISRECSNAIILPGIAVNGIAESKEIIKWLKTIGYEL